MRRPVIAFLTLTMVLTLAACSNDMDKTGPVTDGSTAQKEVPMTEDERARAATQDPDLGDRARRAMDKTDDTIRRGTDGVGDAVRRGVDDVGDAVRRGADDVGDVVRDGKNAVKDALTDDQKQGY